MAFIKVPVVLLLSLIHCTAILGHGQQAGGFGNQGIDNQRNFRGRSAGGFGGDSNGLGGFGGMGPAGRSFGGQFGGQDGNAGKYRANLYFDDDVYGYDANYPGGEALYINYRSDDARARRAQEFARSSPYSSGNVQGLSRSDSFSGRNAGDQRQGGKNHRNSNFGPQW